MKEIFLYFRQYFQEGDNRVFALTTFAVSILVFLNYATGIEHAIKSYPSAAVRLCAFFLLYAFIFISSYAIQFVFSPRNFINRTQFLALLFLCPLLFALKISLKFPAFEYGGSIEEWNKFWQILLSWPLKCIAVLAAIHIIWYRHKYPKPVAGMKKDFIWKPYLLLLICAVPILAIAGTLDDFQSAYPKVKNIAFIYPYTSNDVLCILGYELSYGTDFLTIEAFFRGFAVLAFVRYVGKDAILPMAAFYCTIHFGKPVFECITSYIGGILLGVIVYNTRSIWGGLIVHVGMAWLLEIFTLIYTN